MRYIFIVVLLFPTLLFSQQNRSAGDNIGLSYRKTNRPGTLLVANYEHWLNGKRALRIGYFGNVLNTNGVLFGYRRKWINYKRLLLLGGVEMGIASNLKIERSNYTSIEYHVNLPLDLRIRIINRLSLYFTLNFAYVNRVSDSFKYPVVSFDFHDRWGLIIRL